MRTSNVMTYTHRLASGLTRVIPRLALMAVPLLLIAAIFSACDDDTMTAMPTETPQSVSASTPTLAVPPTSTPLSSSLFTPTPSQVPERDTSTPTPTAPTELTASPTGAPNAYGNATTQSPTQTPTSTPTPTPTSTATPEPTPTVTPTPTPTASPTPAPAPPPYANLVFDVDAAVSGYWSDGTANVEITTPLRNVGNLQFKDVQQVGVTCTQEGRAVDGCVGELSVLLKDGFGPATETLTLRVPMGQVSLEFDYGEDETYALMVDVPERILGVERDVWECFSDRGEPGGFNLDFPCSGWYTETIVKWDQDKPVKVWANPDVNPKYILILEQVLEVVSPILNLEFQWVAAEAEADFVAHVGVDRSNANDIGIHCVDGGGCGLKTVKDGVAYRGRLAVWGLGVEDDDYVYGTTLHEALHSLVPIGHRQRDATSIMSYNSVVDERVIHRMDEALLRLHSHPLIQPGMTMARVRELVVLRDELLDQPELAPLTPMRILEEAYLRLQAAGSAHYTVSLSESNCSDGFGPAVYETANYSFEGPRWTHINDGSDRYYMVQHDERINYELEQPNRGELWSNNTGEWREVDWDKSGRSEALRLYNESSLQDVLIEIFSRPDAADVEVLGRSGGDLTLKARLREEGRHLPASTEITMVLDEQSYKIREYRVKWPAGARCGVSEMRAHDGRYGVEFEFPDAVTEKSEYLSSCGLQTLGTLSGAVTRRAVLPGYCGSDPERSALLFHFRLDSPQSTVNVIAKWHPGPLALRLLDEGETLARGTSSYFTPSTQMNAVLREGEYIVEIETFDALVRGGFDLEVSITPFRSTASVSNGIEHSCALDVEGTPFCWGRTDFLDIDPPAHESFQSISSGAGHTCGLLQDGSAICWGTSFFGETQPPDGERFSAISGGALFTCALRLDGHPVCWGDDSSGQASPPANEEFIAISSGERHACALRADGTPVCWGGGSDRSNSGQASPPDGETLTSISSGSWHTCGLSADGTPICWGTYMVCWLNPDDTVGCEAPDGPSPAQPPADEKFTALSSGSSHTCALRPDGSVVCWGIDDHGKASPPANETFTSISCGAYHTCGVTPEGLVLCWGRNLYGESSPPSLQN